MNPYLKHVAVCACLLFFVFSAAYGAEIRQKNFSSEEIADMNAARAVISTKFGEITIKFFPDVAPNHVSSFLELARSGFYNGTSFHRVIPGFMIQGGDPLSKNPDRRVHGTGGPDYRLKAEFSTKAHKRGILSMARSGHPDSAGSQFFICVADAPYLDGKYTVFGEVVSGMEVADQIVSQPRDPRDNPLEKIEMQIRVSGAEPAKQPEDLNKKKP
ncbi:MAG: peptidylprolyl isomerase [Desulfobacterales bacterium]